MSISTRRLARSAAERPKRMLAIWGAVLVAAIALTGALLANATTTDTRFLTTPEAQKGYDLLEQRLGTQDHAIETVVVQVADGTVDAPAVRAAVEQAAADIRALGPDVVLGVQTAFDPGAERSGLVSADGRTTIIPVVMAGDPNDAVEQVPDVLAIADTLAATAGVSAEVAGRAAASVDTQHISESDLQRGELIGMPIAFLILLLVFRTVGAVVLPLVTAVVGIIVAVGATALVGSVYQLSFFVINMITMMGLAVGIDYALFIVSRYREERVRGADKLDAIERSAATSGRAVAFSGMTVVVALVGLLIVPTNVYFSLALGAILVVLAAIAASMTLLPALLSVMGDRVEWGRVPFLGRSESDGRWAAIVDAVMRRPWIALLGTTALLLLAATPYLGVTTGASGIETLPASAGSRQAYETLQRDFGAGSVAPAVIAVAGDVTSPQGAAALDRLEAALADVPALGTPTRELGPAGDAAALTVPVDAPSTSSVARTAVETLREQTIPTALAGSGLTAYVTGDTAQNLDYFAISDRYLPIVVGLVLALSFLVLMLAFRSIVVPLTAIAMNLLSVGAAYGLLVLVFQDGIGASLLGFQEVEAIEAWIPLFLFAVLFGLSMDYHVFLLSRIREHWLETGDTPGAIRHGIVSSARLISGAALIMVAVFGGFAMGEMVMLQQMGFGLAVAVLLDATIVRSILVPAVMRILGDRNWYFPKALEFLPRVDVEGAGRLQPAGAMAD